MALKRPNPVAIEVIEAEISVSPEEIDAQIQKLIEQIRATDEDLQGWLRKQKRLTQLRVGERQHRTVPWKGASNLSIPVIDGAIRRWKPAVTALVLDADPVATFRGQSPDDVDEARLVEQFFHFLFTEEMDTVLPTVRLVDTIAWRGHAYVCEGWDYRTTREVRIVSTQHLFPQGLQQSIQAAAQQAALEGRDFDPREVVVQKLEAEYMMSRQIPEEGQMLLQAAEKILQGAPYIKLVFRKVLCDKPSWTPLDPVNVIVPQDQPPETAEFFCIIREMSEDGLRALAIDNHLPAEAVEEVIEAGESVDEGPSAAGRARKGITDVMDRRAGKSLRSSADATKSITIWKIFCRLDINGDGERERCVLWYAPGTEKAISLMDFAMPFEEWPITYFPFEARRRPVDNRGIAEMLMPFQKVVNAVYNARIDASHIMLAPVLKRRIIGGDADKAIRWQPGSIIPVTSMDDLQPVVQDLRILGALLQEQQVNQRLAEAFVGAFDSTLTSIENRSERRTAAEIRAVQGLSASIFGLDSKIFAQSLSRSFNKVWQLYKDLGERDRFFRVQNQQMPQRITKAELVKNFDIRASGTPSNTDRALQIQNLERLMQIVFNPVILQSGRLDFMELIRQWMNLIDYNVAQRIVRPEEESAAAQTILQAASIASDGQQFAI